MIADQSEEAADTCCASCGIAEVDEIKLKECDGCDLVRYCSDDCKEDHRSQHEAKCRERAVELRDEILFRQPESSHMGDCPICFLPFPLIPYTSTMTMMWCCSKMICNGCSHVDNTRQWKEKRQQPKCPFCRRPVPKTQEEAKKMKMKRAAAGNDPDAMREMGGKHCNEGDYDSAFKYFTKAAELGDADSHHNLSVLYRKGEGVEKDGAKELYHLEEAAILGHPEARFNLACCEEEKNRYDRAVKHLIIAANLGQDNSIQALQKHYKDGLVSKEDFAAALRAHHAAVNETKSPQREAAAKYYSAHA